MRAFGAVFVRSFARNAFLFEFGEPRAWSRTIETANTYPAPSDLPGIGEAMESSTAEDILDWALHQFRGSIALACSFGGPSGMVLLDMVLQRAPNTPVFYLDTGFLFPQTYALVQRVAERYGVLPQAVRPAISPELQAQTEGDRLWERDPDRCCEIRKVVPQREFLRGYAAWITGIRRDQASTRRRTSVVSWDSNFGLAKIAPLAAWSEQQVWDYIVDHDVPTNSLHGLGYPSIGCTYCTRPVGDGEDARAGRWSGTLKTECGLHRPSDETLSPLIAPQQNGA